MYLSDCKIVHASGVVLLCLHTVINMTKSDFSVMLPIIFSLIFSYRQATCRNIDIFLIVNQEKLTPANQTYRGCNEFIFFQEN